MNGCMKDVNFFAFLTIILFSISIWTDLDQRKIPNLLIFNGFLLKLVFLPFFFISSLNIIINIIFLFLVIGLLYPFWSKNIIGGGDYKLFILVILFLPLGSRFSLFYPYFSNLGPEICQFFVFFSILYISQYIFIRIYRYCTIEEKRKKIVPLSPVISMAFFLSISF